MSRYAAGWAQYSATCLRWDRSDPFTWTTAKIVPAADKAVIEIRRRPTPEGWGLQYRVLVDDVESARIEQRQAAAVSVSPGHYTIRLKSLWYASPARIVDCAPGATVRLACQQQWGLIATFRPRHALLLANDPTDK